MLKLTILLLVAGTALAGVVPEVAVLRQTSNIEPDGSYEWNLELDNGIKAEETGIVRALGPEEGELSAHGSFGWISPEGEKISLSYIADENGYQPEGSHLPVAPPIPDLIQKALDWIAAHPEPALVR